MTGVSTQTVSRVINNRPDVSPETRRAVEAAIEEHGFQPSAVARSLVQRRSLMIGVIAAGLKYFGVAQTVNGITEAAEAAGYSIILKELAQLRRAGHRSRSSTSSSPTGSRGSSSRRPRWAPTSAHLQEQLPRSAPPVVFLKAEPSRHLLDHRDRQRGGGADRDRSTSCPLAGSGSRTFRVRSSGARRATGATAGWPRSPMPAWSRARWRPATGRRPAARRRSRRSWTPIRPWMASSPRATRWPSAPCMLRTRAGSGSPSSWPSSASTACPRPPSSRRR